MAYLVTDKQGNANKIARTMEELHILIGGASNLGLYTEGHIGTLHEISDENFVNIQSGQKFFKYENSTITYTDNNLFVITDKECLDGVIQEKINLMDILIRSEQRSTILTKLKNWKTVLQNLDTSALSYPINSTVEKYLLDQGQEIFSPLQV